MEKNRERLETLVKKAGDAVTARTAKKLELEAVIARSSQQGAVQKATMNEAEGRDDPKAYHAAFALQNMYGDRRRKAEEELAALMRTPEIPAALYNEIADFIQRESSAVANAERAAILEHLQAAVAIEKEASDYMHELAVFAQKCEAANNATLMGEFNLITVSSLPAYLTDELTRVAYYFRPQN